MAIWHLNWWSLNIDRNINALLCWIWPLLHLISIHSLCQNECNSITLSNNPNLHNVQSKRMWSYLFESIILTEITYTQSYFQFDSQWKHFKIQEVNVRIVQLSSKKSKYHYNIYLSKAKILPLSPNPKIYRIFYCHWRK